MLISDNDSVKFLLENVNAEDVIRSGDSKDISLIATYNNENNIEKKSLPIRANLNLIFDFVQK